MTRRGRRSEPPLHPLAPVLIAVIAIGILWPLNHFFGIGQNLLDYAMAGALLFGTVIVMTLTVAAVMDVGLQEVRPGI